MNIDKKLQVLSLIAKELNTQQVTWAVGASLLLYLKKKVSEFQDIDIMVTEADLEKTKKILEALGDIQPQNPHEQYLTRYFLEFIIDDVDVDVMAGFTIVREKKHYYFPLERGTIHDFAEINDEIIPLQSLAEWRNYYELMGRYEKAALIESE